MKENSDVGRGAATPRSTASTDVQRPNVLPSKFRELHARCMPGHGTTARKTTGSPTGPFDHSISSLVPAGRQLAASTSEAQRRVLKDLVLLVKHVKVHPGACELAC